MSPLVAQHGAISLTPTEDYFYTLVDAMASQQISSKAAAAIMGKVRALVPDGEKFDAPTVLGIPDEALRGAGFSWKKVEYVKDLSRRVARRRAATRPTATGVRDDCPRETIAAPTLATRRAPKLSPTPTTAESGASSARSRTSRAAHVPITRSPTYAATANAIAAQTSGS